MNKRIAPQSIIFLLLMSVFLLQAKNGAGQGRKFIEEWRRDSLGCEGFRNDSTAKLLLKYLGESRFNKRKTINVLGKPIAKRQYSNTVGFLYPYNLECKNNKKANLQSRKYIYIEFKKSGKYKAASPWKSYTDPEF